MEIPPRAIRARAIRLLMLGFTLCLIGSAQAQDGQVVISVTDFHNGYCDVKYKSLRTGYIHSKTVRCLSSVLPLLNVSADASPDFKQAVKNCLDRIEALTSADSGSPVARLLNMLLTVPVTVHPRAATDTSNATAYSAPGADTQIYWSSNEGGYYPSDGASRISCATLLHELTHAWENFNGYDSGELQAVRAENWFIWKSNGKQRTKYQTQPLPPNQVIWPQAANPPN